MRYLTIGILALLMACASAGTGVATEPSSAATANASIDCGGDCAAHWKRAEEWLTRHALLAPMTSGDTLIRTAVQSRKYPIYHFLITRPAAGGNAGPISLSLRCGNRLGCRPSADVVQKAFRQFVETGVDSLPPQSRLAGIRE